MHVLVAVLALLAAAPKPLGPVALYRAARAECGGKPGPHTAQLMRGYFAHWLAPDAFGARVLADWSQLTAAQRARFAAAADAKVLAPERTRRIAAFCARRDTFQSTRETSDATTRFVHVMITHHVGGDELQIGWVLAEQAGAWTLDRVEVPSMDYPGIDDDPVELAVRKQLVDYAHAMAFLAR
jgi:hypothetical protein